MKKTIVIPVTEGKLSSHFGHCEQFYFAEVVDNKITNEYMQTPPEHEPGLYPRWVKEQGGSLVIAGGMGPKARALFSENGMETIVGAPTEDPRKVAEDFLNGVLQTSENSCNHH